MLQAAEFDWDMPQKGNMLSSFFYGYVTTQLAGGWLGSRFGGVRVLGASVFASSLLSLLAPTAAYVGYVSLLVTRVFTGVVQVGAAAFALSSCAYNSYFNTIITSSYRYEFYDTF